jgi:hypothetical protein
MHPRDFLLKVADQLAHDLVSNRAITEFTGNSDLKGSYAEQTVRDLVLRMVSPMKVSTGAIIYEGICPGSVPQLDTIIWAPCPVPAIFESGHFALVPRDSAMAFLEIKRSMYPGAGEKMAATLAREDELVLRYQFSGIESPPERSLGVVCLQERGQGDANLSKLAADDRAVVLLVEQADGTLKANPGAMYRLVNFLAGVRLRAKLMDGFFSVNWKAYADPAH